MVQQIHTAFKSKNLNSLMVIVLLSSLTLTSCYKKYDPQDGAQFEKTWNCTSTTGTGVSQVFTMSDGGSGVKVKCNTNVGYGGCGVLIDMIGEANASRISFSTQDKIDACGNHLMVSMGGTIWKKTLTFQKTEYVYHDIVDSVDSKGKPVVGRVIDNVNSDEYTCTY